MPCRLQVWEDGQAFRNLEARQQALVRRREEIEAARKVGFGWDQHRHSQIGAGLTIPMLLCVMQVRCHGLERKAYSRALTGHHTPKEQAQAHLSVL